MSESSDEKNMSAEQNEQKQKEEKAKRDALEETRSETEHTLTIDGERIEYTATAGTLILRKEDGEPRASIFYIAYTRNGVDDPSQRPLTFSFNGGPGSSSVWMHLGMLGPQIVRMNKDGSVPPPPYALDENVHSLLDVSDLIFIDPVSTGFSRPAPGEDAKQFHSYETDIESVGDFIRLITTRLERWNSPKFLIGESYGTTRAAGLAEHLLQRHGMVLNGLMLISSILNFQTARFVVGNDLPYLLFLPTYTATAWYHQALDEDLQEKPLREVLDEVEAFALNEYALALHRGAALPEEERREVALRLARYTGLSADYVERTNLRIQIFRFTKELLRDRRRTVGRLDTRFIGADRDAAGETFEYDPAHAAIGGLYAGALNDYLRRSLKYESDLTYEILTGLFQKWDFNKQNQYLNVGEALRKAITQSPYLRIFVANGYYDLATPYFATEYTFNHLDIDPALRDNISMGYYEAGHMMYVHPPSLAQIKSDLADFIRSSSDPDRSEPLSVLPHP